jgi:ankyrin repeat protein
MCERLIILFKLVKLAEVIYNQKALQYSLLFIIGFQDFVGDTALHDALSKDSTVIIELLLASKKAILDLQNAKGLNTIHQAALHGHLA